MATISPAQVRGAPPGSPLYGPAGAGPRAPTPTPSKASAMPAYKRLGCHHDRGLLPPGPLSLQGHPEQSAAQTEARTRRLVMQGQQSLSQRQILSNEVLSGLKHSHQPAEQVSKANKHGGNLILWRGNEEARKSLRLRTARVLASQCVQGKADMFSGR